MIGERINLIRKKSNLSMQAFGQRLEMSSSNISRLEKGQIDVSERNIKLICSEFDINEEWLRTGKGEMYLVLKTHEELGVELGKLLRERGEYTEFKQKMITHLLKLPESHWMVLNNLINSFVDEELAKIKKSED